MTNTRTSGNITMMQALGSDVKAVTLPNYSVDTSATTTVLNDNMAYYCPIYIPEDCTITGVFHMLQTAGSGTTIGGQTNRIGLYQLNGTNLTKIASTSDTSTLWWAPSVANTLISTPLNPAFGSTIQVTAGTYYIFVLYNFNTQVGVPAIYGKSAPRPEAAGSFNSGMVYISGTYAAQNDLAANYRIDFPSAASSFIPWIGLY